MLLSSLSLTITITGEVTINDHVLTVDEIPSHYHTYIETYSTLANFNGSGSESGKELRTNITKNTENTGGGLGHTHEATLDEATYEKSGSYIKLPFIKKVS